MKALLPVATLFATLITAFLPMYPAAAQQLPPLPVQFNPDKLINPGRPGGRRRGGGSRGDCAVNGNPDEGNPDEGNPAEGDLSAIAYATSQTVRELDVTINQETVGTLTTQAQPTLWFYLPVPLSDQTETNFVVKNEQNVTLYAGQLLGETDRAGIVQVPLGVELAVGTRYQWFLTLNCGGEPSTVNGWIARQAPNPALSRPFAEASPRNRAALFANQGFLQDAITELAALRLANPEDEIVEQDWRALLSALGLADLATMPLLDCCTLPESLP